MATRSAPNSASNPPLSQPTKPSTSRASEVLTNSELQSLRADLKEKIAYGEKAFAPERAAAAARRAAEARTAVSTAA